jgi:hypothetical protein
MEFTYYGWNHDFTNVEKEKWTYPIDKNHNNCSCMNARICMYKHARQLHVEQLNNKCIGLAMLVKEGYLSKDMQKHIRDKYIYRKVPLPRRETQNALQVWGKYSYTTRMLLSDLIMGIVAVLIFVFCNKLFHWAFV